MNIEKILKVEPAPEERLRRQKSRIFFWDASLSVIDLVTHRHDEDSDELAALIPQAIDAAELTGATSFVYRSRACTCGVSPGFIADSWLKDNRGIPYDLHITYTQKEARGKTPPVEEEADVENTDQDGEEVSLSRRKKVSTHKAPVEDLAERRRAGLAKAREVRRQKREERLRAEQAERIPFAAKRSYNRKVTLRNIRPGENALNGH